ncbi:MAG TPA: class I SAM-dependent methyltransferase [Gemmatimonadaceae bacterium]|nr:class I SAM-dependent methyltransferase [Gemmatimonadaceae bacterium]
MERIDRKAHWEGVYATKAPAEVSWYQARPARSLELLAEAGVTATSAVIDVGGGDSTLVDALLERGTERVTVLDLSGAALARARARLGARATGVTWIEADVTSAVLPPGAYDAWHDRAVFHFLTEADDRRRYAEAAASAVRAGGALVIATFAPDGPTRCSALDVVRYDAESLAREFAPQFALVRGLVETHVTPWGAEQRFTYVILRRRESQ